MVAILFAIISIFAFRLRSRAALELKLVAIEHQLAEERAPSLKLSKRPPLTPAKGCVIAR
jgi:hypothetical protein